MGKNYGFGLFNTIIGKWIYCRLLYGVVAIAFVLIYKSSLVVNFAQGEFY